MQVAFDLMLTFATWPAVVKLLLVGVTERDSAVQTSRSDVGVDALLRIHDRKRSELVARLGHLAARKNAPAPCGYEVIS